MASFDQWLKYLLQRELVRSWISEGKLMESELYQSVFDKGEAKGKAGNKAETTIRILMRRMGAVDQSIREKIRGLSDMETLDAWYEEALGVIDAEDARRLVETIQNASSAQSLR